LHRNPLFISYLESDKKSKNHRGRFAAPALSLGAPNRRPPSASLSLDRVAEWKMLAADPLWSTA
jgi:hypothetical protein